MTQKADVLIVTVTEVESRAVIDAFREVSGKEPKPEPIGDRIYLDLGEVNDTRVFMALSEMGSGGVGGSQKSVDKGIEALSPQAVVMVGIAFGINEEKQAIGDILISQQLYLYDLQRVGKDLIVPRGDKPHASSWLINWLQVSKLSWDEARARVRFGVILSGEKLVDNIDYRDQLKQFENEAIGGEMEGAGLYVASHDKKCDWILVKAICDWADGEKATDKDARQRLAAHNAAAFVLQALKHASLKRERSFDLRIELPETSVVVSASRKTIPSSLPSQPYFFGREKELQNIAEAIAPEARTWGVLIDGPGGIGKTALAIRAAHLALDTHFDRKIFLSAKVRELMPHGEQQLEDFALTNFIALLTELARELGDENIEKTEPSERPNAVRRALADVRALIVIDNVETFAEPERVRLYQFLSRLPSTCKAIVTSRRRADIDARVIRLDRLARKDALDLLAELAKTNRYLQNATEQDFSNLYEITNGNPQVLKWTVGQLGRSGSRCRTVTEACEFLKFAPADNDPLEYIFGDLLDTFTETEMQVLAALTHFKEPASVRSIVDVTGLTERVALTALEDLTDRSLLLSDENDQRFILPVLAASFLRRKCAEVIAQAGLRITDRAYALVLENGYKNYDRFSVLQSEWPTIAAALPLLMVGENERLQKTCDALNNFLNFSGYWDERVTLSEFAEQKAAAAGDLYNAGWRAHAAAWIYRLRREPEQVLACLSRCRAYWEESPEAGSRERGIEARLRGRAHMLQKDYVAATAATKEALQIFRAEALINEDVALALADLGEVEYEQENYAAAEAYYREALQTAQKGDYKEGIANFTGNMANLAVMREDWTSAEALALEAHELSKAIGREELVGRTAFCAAKALIAQDRPEDALPYAKEAVEVFTLLRLTRDLEKATTLLKQCGQ
jgi:nucleoside phosphorylase/tetratricopeptide (TPR) repeat protein